MSKTLEMTTLTSAAATDGWKERIGISTALAGIVGAGAGLVVSKHSGIYGANCAIVTASYCGAREFVRANRHKDDLLNSAIGGFGSGALLGRLQGGQLGAIRYSIVFALVGTTMDLATTKLTPMFKSTSGDNHNNWFKLPDWSPIQILDEEALAQKHARENHLAQIRRIKDEP